MEVPKFSTFKHGGIVQCKVNPSCLSFSKVTLVLFFLQLHGMIRDDPVRSLSICKENGHRGKNKQMGMVLKVSHICKIILCGAVHSLKLQNKCCCECRQIPHLQTSSHKNIPYFDPNRGSKRLTVKYLS